MTSPFERIDELHRKFPQERDFAWYLNWFSKHGFVYSNPYFFLMGRPVQRDSPVAALADCTHLFDHATADCWFVHGMAGDLSAAIGAMPWPLPWIAFRRLHYGSVGGKRLAFYRSSELQRLNPPQRDPLKNRTQGLF